MKKLLSVLALTTSLTAAAQSFVLQSNGVLLSIDAEAKMYDLNQFIAPTTIVAKGKNWLLDKNQLLTTIDSKGFVYKKTDSKGPKALKASGGSFFISDKNEMNVVTRDGFIFTYSKDDLIKKGEVVQSGGNWLVIKKDNILNLVTIDTVKGFTYTLAPAALAGLGLNPSLIKEKGGNYLVDSNGVLFTVDKNGLVSNKSSMGKFAGLKKNGANFLVDSFGAVRVVLDNGWMLLPTLPAKLGTISKVNSTQAWDAEDEFFIFAETAPEAELTSSNAAVFSNMLTKLIIMTSEQPDSRTVVF
ncbi:MAG: hypothetical protein K2P81_01845 [Bacteriovoracaceae bacterium]|nr:hypothetical protein [Bacteriovoracaceae bacterium]